MFRRYRADTLGTVGEIEDAANSQPPAARIATQTLRLFVGKSRFQDDELPVATWRRLPVSPRRTASRVHDRRRAALARKSGWHPSRRRDMAVAENLAADPQPIPKEHRDIGGRFVTDRSLPHVKPNLRNPASAKTHQRQAHRAPPRLRARNEIVSVLRANRPIVSSVPDVRSVRTGRCGWQRLMQRTNGADRAQAATFDTGKSPMSAVATNPNGPLGSGFERPPAAWQGRSSSSKHPSRRRRCCGCHQPPNRRRPVERVSPDCSQLRRRHHCRCNRRSPATTLSSTRCAPR